jgi:hypothetical protein
MLSWNLLIKMSRRFGIHGKVVTSTLEIVKSCSTTGVLALALDLLCRNCWAFHTIQTHQSKRGVSERVSAYDAGVPSMENDEKNRMLGNRQITRIGFRIVMVNTTKLYSSMRPIGIVLEYNFTGESSRCARYSASYCTYGLWLYPYSYQWSSMMRTVLYKLSSGRALLLLQCLYKCGAVFYRILQYCNISLNIRGTSTRTPGTILKLAKCRHNHSLKSG